MHWRVWSRLIFVLGSVAVAPALAATVSPESHWGAGASSTVSSNFRSVSDADRVTNAEFLLAPYYRIGDGDRIQLSLRYSKSLENEFLGDFQDTQLKYQKAGIRLNPFMTFSPALILTAPTSKVSRQQNSLLGSASLRPLVNIETGRLSVSQGALLTKNHFEYFADRNGESNSSWSISYLATVAVALGERFSLQGEFSRGFGFTYDGSVKNKFELSEAVEFSVSRNATLSAGVSNSGSAFKENGVDNNIGFLSEDGTTFFGAVRFEY